MKTTLAAAALASLATAWGTSICAAPNALPPNLINLAKQIVDESSSRKASSVSSVAAIDPNYAENQDIRLKKTTNRSGRTIYAWETSYGVVNKDWSQGYYYTNEGKLFGFDFYIGKRFPKKAFGYSYPQGKLVMIGIAVNPEEFYELSRETGELQSSVSGTQSYDASGNAKPGASNQRVIFHSQ